MKVEVVSPERVLFSGVATQVITRTESGGEIAFLPFDLDDARPGIRQPRRAIGRGNGLFHRNDEQALQGLGCHQ